MQTLKKIMFSVFLFVFVGFHFASADITDNLSSPQPTGTNITFYCSTGDRVIFFGADGSFIHRQGCSQSSGTPFTSDTAQEINVVECQSNVSITNCDASGSRNYGAFIATENSSGAYVSLIGYTYTTQTGGGTGERVSGIHFFNDSALTGETSVINQLGASVGTTTGSLLPVVSVVGGVILAMIGIKWIVDTLKSTASRNSSGIQSYKENFSDYNKDTLAYLAKREREDYDKLK